MADLKNKYLELKSKEENKRRVIILKDGAFYRTYDNDAVIIWDQLGYKFNNQSVGIGVDNSRKFFKFFEEKKIGYFTDDVKEFVGNPKLYENYLSIARINYSDSQKKEKLLNLIENCLTKDENNYDKIMKY